MTDYALQLAQRARDTLDAITSRAMMAMEKESRDAITSALTDLRLATQGAAPAVQRCVECGTPLATRFCWYCGAANPTFKQAG